MLMIFFIMFFPTFCPSGIGCELSSAAYTRVLKHLLIA
jgi:hypothetical protein